MSLKSDLLAIDEQLWSGDTDTYRANLDDECLVAFTQMAGVSSREDVAGTVGNGPRWRNLDIEFEGVLQPTPDVAILTYRADAVRPEGERYRALVSSGYVKRNGSWKMMFHQQTPLEST
jgi:hypothetical protein